VNERISEFTRQKPVTALVDLFTQYEVPHAPILGIKEALSQPQAVAREMVVEADHAVLGQHTDEILRDILGLTAERIDELRASKVVAWSIGS
jgi:crotonobetainyl-CoA:carnitine CoA-transferase CaiB-like acyl-CoA transferase